jgi:hypothetical protein
MAEDRPSGDNGIEQDPRDVLAADEFAMPSRAPHPQDPHSEEHEAHDVLAADEFAMPTRGRRVWDPHSDEREPHDVLAADEFAMPGAGVPHGQPSPKPGRGAKVGLAAGIALALLLLRRRG